MIIVLTREDMSHEGLGQRISVVVVLLRSFAGSWSVAVPLALQERPGQRVLINGASGGADLLVLKDLVESGKLRPIVDRAYALGDTAAASHTSRAATPAERSSSQ